MNDGFEFRHEHDGSLGMESAVFQALGAASACWDNLEGAGVFQSDRAKLIGDYLLAFIADTRDDHSPRLGLATTKELIAELHARAEISDAIGEPWPSYRTVDEPPMTTPAAAALRQIKSEMLRQEYVDPTGGPRPSEAETWANIRRILVEALPDQAGVSVAAGSTTEIGEDGRAS